MVNTGFELKDIISPSISIEKLKVSFLHFSLINLINLFRWLKAIIIEINTFCILIRFVYFVDFFLLVILVCLIKFWFCSTFIIFYRELQFRTLMHKRLPNTTIALKNIILIPTHYIYSTLVAKVKMRFNNLLILLLVLKTLHLVEKSWLGTVTFLEAEGFHLEDIFCLRDFFALVLRDWILRHEIFWQFYHIGVKSSVDNFNIALCFDLFLYTFFIWNFNQK